MQAGSQVAANAHYLAWSIKVLSGTNTGEVDLYDLDTKTLAKPLASASAPDFVALDDSWLYWFDASDVIIGRVPLTGGSPQGVLGNFGEGLNGMATDGTNVYFTVGPNATTSMPGRVYYIPVNGAANPSLLFSGGTPQQIIAAGGMVFWIDSSDAYIYGVRFP